MSAYGIAVRATEDSEESEAPGSSPDGESFALQGDDLFESAWRSRYQQAAGGGNADGGDDGLRGGSGTRPLPMRQGETPMPVSPVLTKLSPACANPASIYMTMEHFRNFMLLQSDPLDTKSPNEKWYQMVTPASQCGFTDGKIPRYDGSAHCVVRRMSSVLDKTTDESSKLQSVKRRIKELLARQGPRDAKAAWSGISIEMHVPMQSLLPETDDRDGHAIHSIGFCVNEQMILKRGRDSWQRIDAKHRVLNTKARIRVGDEILVFSYVDGRPQMRKFESVGDGEHCSGIWDNAKIPSQEFTEMLDFAQYTEREIAEVSPGDYIPMKTLHLLSLVEKWSEEQSITAVLKHTGHTIRYDEGRWWCWTQNNGWSKDDSDASIRTAIRAAATDLEKSLTDMSSSPRFDQLRAAALGWFHKDSGPDEDKELPDDKQPRTKARKRKILPSSDRGLSSFIANLQPWISERGFAKSFEQCKDIAFKNCVQQMVPPFARHTETPADRVTNRFDCHLPSEAQAAELEGVALKPFTDIFMDDDVALREADKMACLLTGTCAVMPEANIRVQVGPYNKEAGQFAGRVGKDTIGNHVKALMGGSLSTDWGMAMLSAYIDPDRNNPAFEGLETHLGHWITDGSANRRDGTESLRKWGDLPKKIWAGGAPSHFPVTLKHKNKMPVLPRSNAVYVCAQRFNIGDDVAIWGRLECSPYPRVGDIPENQPLISNGIPKFQIDPNYVNAATSMDDCTRSKHLCYLVNRAVTILKDPKAAHPPTDKHHAAKEQLKEVAGGMGAASNITAADDAYGDLIVLIGDRLHPCFPKGVDAHLDNDLAPRRKQFQTKAPRCFCHKKPVAQACSFQVSELADLLRTKYPGAYAHYVQRPDRLAKLTEAVQRALALDATGVITRANGFHRDAIFGWTLVEEKAEESPEADHEAPDAELMKMDENEQGNASSPMHQADAEVVVSKKRTRGSDSPRGPEREKNKEKEKAADSESEKELSDSSGSEKSERSELDSESEESSSEDEDASATSSDEEEEETPVKKTTASKGLARGRRS